MKADSSRVFPEIANVAIERADGDRAKAWSEYIRAMWQSTGCLAPRCNARDFYAYYDEVKK